MLDDILRIISFQRQHETNIIIVLKYALFHGSEVIWNWAGQYREVRWWNNNAEVNSCPSLDIREEWLDKDRLQP